MLLVSYSGHLLRYDLRNLETDITCHKAANGNAIEWVLNLDGKIGVVKYATVRSLEIIDLHTLNTLRRMRCDDLIRVQRHPVIHDRIYHFEVPVVPINGTTLVARLTSNEMSLISFARRSRVTRLLDAVETSIRNLKNRVEFLHNALWL